MVIPRRECVGVGEGTLIIIPRCGPDAFYRVRILEGIWGLSPLYGVRGEACGKTSLRAFQRTKMSPQDTQLNTISYIFLPKSN